MPQPPLSISGRWIHASERDAGGVRTYVREDAPLPRSRLPRELLDIRDDGTVSRFRPGPADARIREDGVWQVGGDGTVVLRWAGAAGPETLRLAGATAPELRFTEGTDDGGDGA